MFAPLKLLLAGVLLTVPANALTCTDGRTCVYMAACKNELKAGCPLAYSYKVDGDVLSVELAGYADAGTGRYLALGFNEDQKMSNARVTECSAIGTETKPSVKLSVNKDGGTNNLRIENEPDFRADIITQLEAKYENGMIYCSWTQKLGAYNNDKVFQPQPGVKYHHLVAYGVTSDTGLRKHTDADYTQYEAIFPATGLNCNDGRTCVYMEACKNLLDVGCPLAYSYKIDGEVLSVELAGYADAGTGRYLALGFNEEQRMSNARVTECSAIGDEKLSVKLSVNQATGTNNLRIDNEPNFRADIITQLDARYDNGMIYCSWTQKLGAYNNDKVFQPQPGVKYHHLVAYGVTSDTGLHKHTDADYTQFEVFVEPSSPTLNCDDGRNCVYMDACNNKFTADCPLAYSYLLDGDDLSLELIGYQSKATDRYLAIGFNVNGGMPDSRVTECSALKDELLPTLKLSYNQPGEGNVRITDETKFRDQIIKNPVVKYENGVLYCSWTQAVGTFNNDKVFQHITNNTYHHVVAYGPTTADGLDVHDKAQDVFFGRFEPYEDNTDDSGLLNCDGGRTCVYFKTCKGVLNSACPLAYSFKLDGDILDMQLVGYQKSGMNRYLAVGFGEKEGMAESRVTECSAIGDEKVPTVKLSYNTPGDESVNVRIDGEPGFRNTIIPDASSKYEDGMIYCSWKQNVGAHDNDKVFQRKDGVSYYHIVAYGPTAVDGDYAGLDQHDATDNPLKSDFKTSEAAGDSTSTKLVKAHGSLMMIAWLIAVPIAAIFARFLRSHWPTKKPFGLAIWFHVHRTFNILACLVIIAGFVCIFIETGWKWRGVGSSSSYWVATHSTVGIIACVLAWLQPFISILRCDPQNPRRPIFNWIHRLIGMTAFLLAVTATAIAANNFGVWTEHLTYLILSLVPLGSIIVLFVIMTILDANVHVDDHNIVKIHAIRFTLALVSIAAAAATAIALVVLLIMA